MQLKEFSVFIDVERLEAGKFDNNLLNSIRQAKNFLLVLTPNALDRCIGDTECKDWVHRVCMSDNVYVKNSSLFHLSSFFSLFMLTSTCLKIFNAGIIYLHIFYKCGLKRIQIFHV